MDRTAAIADVHRGIGFRADQTDNIIAALAKAQDELETGTSLPWFIISEDETITLAAGSGTFTLPTNFIREVEDEGLDSFANSDLSHLDRVDYDMALAQYGDSTYSYPLVYALRKDSLQFFPVPVTELTLTWSYYARQDSLLSATTNAWLDRFPHLLIGMAGVDVASNLRDATAVAKFSKQVNDWRPLLIREMSAREMSNRRYAMGSAL
jgi:hypothetical protein